MSKEIETQKEQEQQTRFQLECREKKIINTDTQRRCYYGVNFNGIEVWGNWYKLISNVPKDKIETTLKWWRDLNDYCVSIGGKASEFRIVEIKLI